MSESSKSVIVLGVEPRITVPVARSLQRLGISVSVASISSLDPKLHSRSIRDFVRLPHPDQAREGFVSALSAHIKARKADMLIPVTDGALSAVSSHYDELSSLVHVACPPPAITGRVLNKEATLAVADQCGIRIPHEYAISKTTGINSLPQLAFPVVAKPRQKSSTETFKVRYLRSKSELEQALESGSLEDAILQEYCEGEGVGVEMLIHEGRCIAAFQHRRLAEFPHTGGVAVKAVAEAIDPKLQAAALRLLLALEWEGVAMVEFRDDRRTGTAALMEVNGRYWGTLSLPIQAGVDFPAYHWQVVHGEVPSVPAGYAVGLIWRWTAGSLKRWHGVLRSGGTRLSKPATQPVMTSSNTRDALWIASDPWPAVLEFLKTGRTLVRSDARALLKRILPKRTVAALRGKPLPPPAVQRPEHLGE